MGGQSPLFGPASHTAPINSLHSIYFSARPSVCREANKRLQGFGLELLPGKVNYRMLRSRCPLKERGDNVITHGLMRGKSHGEPFNQHGFIDTGRFPYAFLYGSNSFS